MGAVTMGQAHSAGSSLEEGLRTLASLELLPIAQRHLADEAADKLAGLGLYVAVIGEFKRGKTTLINALLGADLLPTGVLPVTAIPALVRFGRQPQSTLRLLDGSEVSVDIAGLPSYLTEQENPGNRKGVREAIIDYPAALLENGLILVDTPGTGSLHLHNTQAAVDFLPRVDVALLVLSVDAPLSESEARLLESVSGTAARIAVCLNKVDRLTPNETREAVEFVRARVALCTTSDVTVFAVSARGGDADTGLRELTTWLENDVAATQINLSGERGVRVAATLLSLVDATLQLEAAAAAKPARDAAAARTAFTAAQTALASAVDEESTLLLAACKRVTDTVIEPRAHALREALPPLLLAATDAGWPDRIAAAAGSWRHEVGEALIAAMRGPVDRHTERVHELATRFVAEVDQAFGVRLPTAFDVSSRVDVDAVRVDLADAPGALAVGLHQVRTRVPGTVGRRWRERARRERAIEDADRLAGRLRYATLQSVDRTARAWIRESELSSLGLSEALAGAVARAELAAERHDATVADSSDVRARIESVRRSLRRG
jgi:GTP-binding protein EngB required for normal cell division